MAENVKVSLLHRVSFRTSSSEPYTTYEKGIREMPIEHARAMGLLHRIVKQASPEEPVVKGPFGGIFDENLTNILVTAGYKDVRALRRASQDELLALDGIGPANYERIQVALRGAK